MYKRSLQAHLIEDDACRLFTPLSFGEGLGVRLLGGEAVLLIRLNSIHKSELYAVGIIILQTALVRIVKLATYVS